MRICLNHFAIVLAVVSITFTPAALARGPACPADIAPLPGGDCVVNVSDLLLVIAEWGDMAGSPADIIGDGTMTLVEVARSGKMKVIGKAPVGSAPKRVAFLPVN